MFLRRWGGKPSSRRKGTHRSVSLPVAAALLTACCGLAAAAQKSPKAAPQQGGASPALHAQTNLTMVRVVVRDAKGNPVSGLSRSDFHLFDDKKEQAISYFSAEAPPAASTAAPAGTKPSGSVTRNLPPLALGTQPKAPQRYTAIFFDDYHLELGNLGQIRDAAKRYLDKSLDQGARVALYSTSGRVHLDFTSDRAKLEEAVTNLKFDLRFEAATECPPMDDYQAQSIVENDQGSAIGGADPGAGGGGLISGQHSAVRAPAPGPANSMGADEGALAVAQGLADAEKCHEDDLAARASYIARENRQNAETTLNALGALVQRIAQTPGGERTIAMVSQGFLDKNLQERMDALIDGALRAKVIVNALDANGEYTPQGTEAYGELWHIDASGRLPAAYSKLQVKSVDFDADVMAQVAEGTGGIFIKNNNDFEGGLGKMAAPYTTYVLGFSPAGIKFDGRFHALVVKLRSTGSFTVQARRGYFAPKQAESIAMAENDELERAVFSQDDLNGLPVQFSSTLSKVDPQTTKLSVTVRMDVQSLRFRKENGRNLDDVTFMLALFDADGNYVTGQKKTINMHLSDATLKRLSTTGLTITESVSVKPGSYMVRGVLLDADSQHLGSGTENITVP